MESSITKFKPYKRILNKDVSLEDSMCEEDELPVMFHKKKKRKSYETSSSYGSTKRTSDSIQDINTVRGKKPKSKKSKQSSNCPNESPSDSSLAVESKDNKENNTKEDIVLLEDLNDSLNVQSSQIDDCLIVLDANANIKQPGSPIVTFNLNSPGKILNSNSLCNSERSSPGGKRHLESSDNVTLSERRKCKKLKCDSHTVGPSKRNLNDLELSHLDKLLDKANTIQTNVIDISEENFISTAPDKVSLIEIIDDPNHLNGSSTLSIDNSRINPTSKASTSTKTDIPSEVAISNGNVSSRKTDISTIDYTKDVNKSQPKCSSHSDDTIIIDDSTIISDSQTCGSDVLIIHDSIIIDLELISTPIPSVEPLIVYDGNEKKPSTR